MPKSPRITKETLKVFGALVQCPIDELSGADIGRATHLATGTLYPILMRLEDAGWLESRWEAETPQALGRPRRRLYRMTAEGARQYQTEAQALGPAIGTVQWT